LLLKIESERIRIDSSSKIIRQRDYLIGISGTGYTILFEWAMKNIDLSRTLRYFI
jgi:hypothetical protein